MPAGFGKSRARADELYVMPTTFVADQGRLA